MSCIRSVVIPNSKTVVEAFAWIFPTRFLPEKIQVDQKSLENFAHPK